MTIRQERQDSNCISPTCSDYLSQGSPLIQGNDRRSIISAKNKTRHSLDNLQNENIVVNIICCIEGTLTETLNNLYVYKCRKSVPNIVLIHWNLSSECLVLSPTDRQSWQENIEESVTWYSLFSHDNVTSISHVDHITTPDTADHLIVRYVSPLYICVSIVRLSSSLTQSRQ